MRQHEFLQLVLTEKQAAELLCRGIQGFIERCQGIWRHRSQSSTNG